MGLVLALVCLAVGGVLLGGVVSLRQQRAATAAVVVVGALGLLAVTAGVLTLVGEMTG